VAKVTNNLVIHGLSGMLGKQIVVRRMKDGTFIVSAAPRRRTDAPLSEAQKAHLERFRRAVLYAKSARTRPEYQEAAKARGLSAQNVAVADFMHPPEIQSVDLSGYDGAAGQTIAITAVDDVLVKTVGVRITTADGTVVEKGTAVVSTDDPALWTYQATAAAPSGAVKVVVDAADLAGQVTEKVTEPAR